MELLQLKYFIALAHNEHLTKTAREFVVTPSAISISLARLEEELGVKLFDRIGRNLHLNSFGQAYFAHVEKALGALRDGASELDEMKHSGRRDLTFGLVNPFLWQNPLQLFHTIHPEIHVRQIAFDTGTARPALPKEGVDFIVASPDSVYDPLWDYELLFNDRVLLAVPKDHPFASRKSIDLSEARDEWFINSLNNTSFRSFCDKLCEQAGFVPKSKIECDYLLRPKMLERENMVCLTTYHGKLSGIFDETTLIDISSPNNIRPQAIFWRKSQYQTQSMKTFRHFMVDYFKDYPHLGKHLPSAERDSH